MSLEPKFETAVLIDGENIPANSYERLQKALKSYEPIGTIRVYGDFSKTAHADWLEVCRKCAIAAELHLPVSIGKNGTDIVMTIAAMDIMASGKFGTIVLVSDDSDFLPVARRLRASGLTVVSAGRKPHLAQHSTYSARVQFAALSPQGAVVSREPQDEPQRHHVVQPAQWSRPSGYSHAIAARGTQVHIAGQIGWDRNHQLAHGDFTAQARQALRNIVDILSAAGGHLLCVSLVD